MIIQSLVKYYDILTAADEKLADKDRKIPVYGYAFCKADFLITLSAEGEIVSVASLKEGKKRTEFVMPFQGDHTNSITPFFSWDNVIYALGLSDSNDQKKIDKAKEKFASFVALHDDLLTNQEQEEAQAFLKFLHSWQPEDAKNNQEIAQYLEEMLKGGNVIFRLQGKINFFHNSPCFKQVWDDYLETRKTGTSGFCLVTGKTAPIELTHTTIKNVLGANAKGGAIVSYNDPAFCSYGKAQSLNGPIGLKSAFAYTTALNYMLSNSEQKIYMDNMTLVFWAEKQGEIYNDISRYLINPYPFVPKEAEPQIVEEDKAMRQLIFDILLKIKQRQPIYKDIDEDVRFYILGLTANNARLAVSFWYQNSFGNFIHNIAQHHLDMEICHSFKERNVVAIGDILRETVPKNSSDKKAPNIFTAAILRTIINNQLYPMRVYAQIIGRIRIDKDTNPTRIGFIKAYLLRKARIYQLLNKEEITVSLNKETTNIPYRLGRLFAILEKAQIEALGSGINATIKDKYFGSAMTTPAAVFPTLIKLSNHHTSKAEYGYALEHKKAEILNGVDVTSFPARLTLDEQGMFALGYYHQVADIYTKKEKKNGEE